MAFWENLALAILLRRHKPSEHRPYKELPEPKPDPLPAQTTPAWECRVGRAQSRCVVSAHTRSEARAKVKKLIGRLPAGFELKRAQD